MKIIKYLVIGIVGLIALALIAALFMKKDFSVKRSIVIKYPVEKTFDYVKLLKNQDFYTKWNKMDPDMKKFYVGVDGTVGFISGWDSKNDSVGSGEQEITKIVPLEKVYTELRFIRPMESKGNSVMTTTQINDGTTQVDWEFYGTFDWPSNLFLPALNMDATLGDDLETGLQNLKIVLESENEHILN